jgi:hypothetical protein
MCSWQGCEPVFLLAAAEPAVPPARLLRLLRLLSLLSWGRCCGWLAAGGDTFNVADIKDLSKEEK